jgi:hypothetical protein
LTNVRRKSAGSRNKSQLLFSTWGKTELRFSTIKAHINLKGQSHEKVGEMRVQGDSLGPN